jgi:hypothetical protein
MSHPAAEVLFGRSVRWAIIIRKVEVRHAAIEGSTNNSSSRLEDIRTAKVLP